MENDWVKAQKRRLSPTIVFRAPLLPPMSVLFSVSILVLYFPRFFGPVEQLGADAFEATKEIKVLSVANGKQKSEHDKMKHVTQRYT